MKRNFVVDARLLRELGERLVGEPHIALAELIKNSYDADATQVHITFDGDAIEVVDDGHGMTLKDFDDRWLRIGTTHKDEQERSPRFGRSLTGSKGVGRLSAQLLADSLSLETRYDGERLVRATVDWDAAVEAGLLTEYPIQVTTSARSGTTFAGGAEHGTRILLTGLKSDWDADAFENVAREIWPLQPPFHDAAGPDADAFHVELRSTFADVETAFADQMGRVLELWNARILGRLLPEATPVPADAAAVERPSDVAGRDAGHADDSDVAADFLYDGTDSGLPPRVVELEVEFADRDSYRIAYVLPECSVDMLDFEIRVFDLRNRQPFGVTVREARKYLRRFGGVHVYDAGFHMPYYGPDTDWLHIEIDHSHRLSNSRLLPDDLRAPDGLRFLPTNSRLFGVVNVNTSLEQRRARTRELRTQEALNIQVTRDRLVGNRAYRDLVTAVRWAVDFYAQHEARRSYTKRLEQTRVDELPSAHFERVAAVIERHSASLEPQLREVLTREVAEATEVAEKLETGQSVRSGLLAALATAGISAMAIEHEAARELRTLRRLTQSARRLETRLNEPSLRELLDALERWLERSEEIRGLFQPILTEEGRRRPSRRFSARRLVEDVARQTRPLMRAVFVETDGVPDAMKLPHGSHAEWSALFQNLLINAHNAMLDRDRKIIAVVGRQTEMTGSIRVQDTGVGVDLSRADKLFEPFERDLKVSRSRSGLVIGGSGLGLTIVRMLAEGLSCKVAFVPPDPGFSTAVEISWREKR
ncbi:MAG: ATP-binding protein [Actinobacteria bacterium]|jgi:signal transduction histidine kinase|nr:ATP-binding protein [Actinomycetota bacterium]